MGLQGQFHKLAGRQFVASQQCIGEHDTLPTAGGVERQVSMPQTGAAQPLGRFHTPRRQPGSPLAVVVLVQQGLGEQLRRGRADRQTRGHLRRRRGEHGGAGDLQGLDLAVGLGRGVADVADVGVSLMAPEVRGMVGRADLQVEPRIGDVEVGEPPDQPPVGEPWNAPDHETAVVAAASEVDGGPADLLDRRRDPRQVLRPFRREPATLVAVDQLHARPGLQSTEVAADGGVIDT